MTDVKDLQSLLERVEKAEEWRPIPGWPYEASNIGRIRSQRSGKILRPGRTSKGYLKITLQVDKRRQDVRVHRAVYEAWRGQLGSQTVNHKNAVKDDNRIENLEACSIAENVAHAKRLGLQPKGDANGARKFPHRVARGERAARSKLTEADVISIREARAGGATLDQLAVRYSVDRSLISQISRRKIWTHL